MYLRSLRTLRSLVLTAACAALLTTPGRAEVLLTKGHTDVGANYEGGAWEFEIHSEETDTEYDPADAILVVRKSARIGRPTSSAYDFLGVAPGEDVWILPQTEDPDLLFLGLASEETDPAEFGAWSPGDPRLPAGDFNWLQWDLVSVNAPAGAQFSLFNTDSFGDPLLWMSTYSNPNPNSFYQIVGGHSHVNWAFTAPGDYELTFRVKALLADGTFTESDEGTFRFRVLGTRQAVPEPSTLALSVLGLGLAAGIHWRRRGR